MLTLKGKVAGCMNRPTCFSIVESGTEAVGERNHSDWLFSLSESAHEKRSGS